MLLVPEGPAPDTDAMPVQELVWMMCVPHDPRGGHVLEQMGVQWGVAWWWSTSCTGQPRCGMLSIPIPSRASAPYAALTSTGGRMWHTSLRCVAVRSSSQLLHGLWVRSSVARTRMWHGLNHIHSVGFRLTRGSRRPTRRHRQRV